MRVLKKIFTSYTFSVPLFALGIVLLSQSSSGGIDNLIVGADISGAGANQLFKVKLVLLLVGGICLLSAIISLLTKYLLREKDG